MHLDRYSATVRIRCKYDPIDQRAQCGNGLGLTIGISQCGLKPDDLTTVVSRYRRVQRYDGKGILLLQFRRRRVAVAAGLGESIANLVKRAAARGDRTNEPFDTGVGGGNAALDRAALPTHPARPLGVFGLVFGDEDLNQLRVEHTLAQTGDDPPLVAIGRDRPVVRAATTLHPATAAPIGRSPDVPRATAGSANTESGQHVTRTAMLHGRASLATTQSGLNLIPQFLIDDAQVRHLLDHPLLRRVGSDANATGHRFDDLGGPVVDDAANIKFVLEHSVAAGAVGTQRRRAPAIAARTGNALGVQPFGDLFGASAIGVVLKDSVHDQRLLWIDLAESPDSATVGIDAVGHAVGVCKAGR